MFEYDGRGLCSGDNEMFWFWHYTLHQFLMICVVYLWVLMLGLDRLKLSARFEIIAVYVFAYSMKCSNKSMPGIIILCLVVYSIELKQKPKTNFEDILE